ncbi:uncharacterized protein DS421_7g218910 [Arachis hypogaea]|nr:uncharacterized protein DS421_7g218910 [Arachis hypogaea]
MTRFPFHPQPSSCSSSLQPLSPLKRKHTRKQGRTSERAEGRRELHRAVIQPVASAASSIARYCRPGITANLAPPRSRRASANTARSRERQMEKRAAEGGRAADCSRRWVLVPPRRRSCSQPRWSRRGATSCAGLHAANVAGVVAIRERARQTVAELSLPPCPAAVGSPAVAHGVTPVSFCRRKIPLLSSPENSAAAIIRNSGRRHHSRIIGGAAAGLPLNRFGDRRCFGSTVPPSVRVVETVAKVAWNRGFGCRDSDYRFRVEAERTLLDVWVMELHFEEGTLSKNCFMY